jgi:hypothetical protein
MEPFPISLSVGVRARGDRLRRREPKFCSGLRLTTGESSELFSLVPNAPRNKVREGRVYGGVTDSERQALMNLSQAA